jgi:hypothetical protein
LWWETDVAFVVDGGVQSVYFLLFCILWLCARKVYLRGKRCGDY